MTAPSAPPTPFNVSETNLGQLSFVLEEMVEGYEKLLSLLQEEKSLIIEGDHEGLVSCIDQKENRLTLLSRLEKKRQKAILKIDPTTPPLTLKALIPRLPIAFHDPFSSFHARLEALCASVQEINEMNGLLVNRVLGQITGLLGLLQQMTGNRNTYQSTGLIHDQASHGRTIARG